MISESVHISIDTTGFDPALLDKGNWIAVLHAQRVPPHVGLMFNGRYYSLTIKEREMGIRSELLLKTIRQKKIKSVFVRVVPHPVFSIGHREEMYIEHLNKFTSVKQFEATCLSPVKLFFKEFYAICSEENELFYAFMQCLANNKFIDLAFALNMELNDGIDLPYYTFEELNEKIIAERKPYYND